MIPAVLTALLFATGLGAGEVYRWVDEEGNVHYSESLPPDFQDQGHDVLDDSGLVLDEDLKMTPEPPPPEPEPEEEQPPELPTDASGLPRARALYTESELQQRMDNFLMLRYRSEQEILDARDVEIDQLDYDERLLETSRKSMLDGYRSRVREAANHQRAGTPVDEGLIRDIHNLKVELRQNALALESLRERENKIRADFQKQLERYRTLVQGPDEES